MSHSSLIPLRRLPKNLPSDMMEIITACLQVRQGWHRYINACR